MEENNCYSCLLCTFHCAIGSYICDVDSHVINDEFEEGCEDYFIEDE